MKRIVKFRPAFDKRDPNPSKNYGIGSVSMFMILTGKRGAVQFLLYTAWHLPNIVEEFKGKPSLQPLPADLSYHSPKPMYEGHESLEKSCEWLGGRPCYYDGSVLAARRIYNVLLIEGDEGLWRELEAYYVSVFGRLE